MSRKNVGNSGRTQPGGKIEGRLASRASDHQSAVLA
jgi:hypothetical protein